MTVEQLKEKGAIYLENVEDGLGNYENRTVTLDQETAMAEITRLCDTLGWENAFADFYYYTFSEDIQQKPRECLEEEEKEYLDRKQPKEGELIFPLDRTLLSILTKWNSREMLFSTVYFTGAPGARATWWSNYNQQYILFLDAE